MSSVAANVRQSQRRVVIARLGLPKPRLQECRALRTRRLFFGDYARAARAGHQLTGSALPSS